MSLVIRARTGATLAALSLTALSLAACNTDAPVAPGTLPGPRAEGRSSVIIVKPKPQYYFVGILFTSTQDDPRGEIYSMNPDGSNVYRITTDTLADAFPDASPAGPAFAFVHHPTSGIGSELFVQNYDGTHRTQLTAIGTTVVAPRYSPDGSRIAFAAEIGGGGFEIYTVKTDGTGLTRLTFNAANDTYPTWSPDGARIAFQSNRTGLPTIWVMNADGSNQQQLVSCTWPGCVTPEWNPLGGELAVARAGGAGIVTVNETTGAQTGFIPYVAGSDVQPTWSKDGQRIVFASSRAGGHYDIYSALPTRSSTAPNPATRLTNVTTGDAQTPAYSR